MLIVFADEKIAIEMSFLEMSGCFAIHFRRSSCACSSSFSRLTGRRIRVAASENRPMILQLPFREDTLTPLGEILRTGFENQD